MNTTYWLSSQSMTFGVETGAGDVIVSAPPIARGFLGQKLAALTAWMTQQGGFRLSRLDPFTRQGVHVNPIPPRIDAFRGEYRFLSNFYPAVVVLYDHSYPTVEHAYQAAKAALPVQRIPFRHPGVTPGDAKRLGRELPLRPDWDEAMSLAVMRNLVYQKFTRRPDLGAQLLATGDTELVEGNDWNDAFWGVCRGQGENWLGRILMETRTALAALTAARSPSP